MIVGDLMRQQAPGTLNLNPESGTWNMERGTRNPALKPGTWTRHLEPGTRNPAPHFLKISNLSLF